MENQIISNQSQLTSNLISTVQSLSTNLALIKPDNSQTTQLITYTLLATAIVGIFVYHYIKSQENL